MDFVRIAIYPDSRARLNSLKQRGESIDHLLQKMMDLYERFDELERLQSISHFVRKGK